jgi:hypothetical protein
MMKVRSVDFTVLMEVLYRGKTVTTTIFKQPAHGRITSLYLNQSLHLHRFLHLGMRCDAIDIGLQIWPFAESPAFFLRGCTS